MATNIQTFLTIFIVLLELGGFANGFECWSGLVSRHPVVKSQKVRQITCSELKGENVCYAVKCTEEHEDQNATIHVYDCEEDRAPCYSFYGIQSWVRRKTGLKKLHCDCIVCHNSNCNKDLFPYETKVALNVNTSAEQEESAAETELPYSENTTAGQLAFVRSDSAEEPEANHTVIESGSKKRAHAIEVFDVTSSEHSSADASAEDKTVGEPISFNTGSSSLAIDGTHASEESGSKPSEAIPEESGSKSLEANDGPSEKSGSKSPEADDGSAEESGSKSLEADDGSAEESGSKSLEANDGPSEKSGSKSLEANYGYAKESGSKSPEADDGSAEESGSKSPEADDGSAEESGSKSLEADDGSSEESGSKSLEANDGSPEESGSKSLEAIGDPLSSEEMDIGWEI